MRVLPDHWVYRPMAAAMNAAEGSSQYVIRGLVGRLQRINLLLGYLHRRRIPLKRRISQSPGCTKDL